MSHRSPSKMYLRGERTDVSFYKKTSSSFLKEVTLIPHHSQGYQHLIYYLLHSWLLKSQIRIDRRLASLVDCKTHKHPLLYSNQQIKAHLLNIRFLVSTTNIMIQKIHPLRREVGVWY